MQLISLDWTTPQRAESQAQVKVSAFLSKLPSREMRTTLMNLVHEFKETLHLFVPKTEKIFKNLKAYSLRTPMRKNFEFTVKRGCEVRYAI